MIIEYADTPAVWFVVDSDLYTEKIDVNVDEIRDLIRTYICRCLAFKRLHPDMVDGPCP